MRQLRWIVVGLAASAGVGCTKTVVLKEPEPVRISAAPPAAPPPKPEPPPKRVEVKKEKIEVNEKIHFEFDSAEIKSESDDLLAEIAQVINAHPELVKIRIEGHTDNVGGKAYNLDLSKRRAAAVRDHLVNKGGVDASRLSTEGYGFEKPIADNSTEEGRAKNRRVAFTIVKRNMDLAPPPPKPGAAAGDDSDAADDAGDGDAAAGDDAGSGASDADDDSNKGGQ